MFDSSFSWLFPEWLSCVRPNLSTGFHALQNLSTGWNSLDQTCRHVVSGLIQPVDMLALVACSPLANGRPTASSNSYFFESKFESRSDTSAPNLLTCWLMPCRTCRHVKPVDWLFYALRNLSTGFLLCSPNFFRFVSSTKLELK